MLNKLFWKDTAERALKTFAQALAALLIIAPNTPIIGFDWPVLLGTALTAAVISVVTSVASAGVHTTASPASLAKDDRGI